MNNFHSSDGAGRWIKVDSNTIEINVDLAIFEEERKFGYVFVARSSDEKLLNALAKCLVGIVTSSLMEAVGIKDVPNWLETQKVVVESDSLVIIRTIGSSTIILSGFGLVVKECKVFFRYLSNVKL